MCSPTLVGGRNAKGPRSGGPFGAKRGRDQAVSATFVHSSVTVPVKVPVPEVWLA